MIMEKDCYEKTRARLRDCGHLLRSKTTTRCAGFLSSLICGDKKGLCELAKQSIYNDRDIRTFVRKKTKLGNS